MLSHVKKLLTWTKTVRIVKFCKTETCHFLKGWKHKIW